MNKIEWNGELELGIPEMDLHHRNLIGILNSLADAMLVGEASAIIEKISEQLFKYTVMHFFAEEVLLASDPKIPESYIRYHQRLHNQFIGKIIEFRHLIKQGDRMVSRDIFIFLKKWILEHIRLEDRKYGNYFKKMDSASMNNLVRNPAADSAAPRTQVKFRQRIEMLKWDAQLSVGVPELDNHHRAIIALMNKLGDSINMSSSFQILSDVLNDLFKYIIVHFSAEEQYMIDTNYAAAEFELHKIQHDSFIEELFDLKNGITGTPSVDEAVHLHNFLND